jgi:hypothetical protein
LSTLRSVPVIQVGITSEVPRIRIRTPNDSMEIDP